MKIHARESAFQSTNFHLSTLARKTLPPTITTIAFCPSKQRLYYGQSNGELSFWSLTVTGHGSSRHVGSHKGPVTCICIPPARGIERSCLSAGGLFLSGAVGGDIKIWDYQGKVTLEPTVVVQTLHGHSGTITAIFVNNSYILSSSTDGTVRVWKTVEGRGQLLYPWYDLQAVVASVNGWARSMTYDRSHEVGDTGAYFVSDESNVVTRIIPNINSAHDNDAAAYRTCGFVVNNQLPKGDINTSSGALGMSSRAPASAIPCLHDHGVAAVRFVGDWQLLLALCYDNCLRGYDTETGICKFVQMNENRCMFTSLEVDNKNGEVLAVDKLGSLFIFCMNTGELIASKKLTKAPIIQICAVLGRERYAVATEQEVSVWCVRHEHEYTKLRGGHTRAVVALHACSGEKGTYGGHPGEGNDPDFRVLSASTDGTMRVWDPYDMSCARVIHQEFSEISAMSFHEAKDIMVTGHDNGDVRLWDMSSGSPQLLRQHSNTVTAVLVVLLKRNEELLITTGYDGIVVVWDILNLRAQPPNMIAKFKASGDARASPASALPGSRPASSVSQAASQPATLPEAAAEKVAAKRHNADPGRIDNGTAHQLEIKLPRCVWSLMGGYLGQHVGHTDAVACLALDANFLFSGSEDCTIRVWDAVPASSKPATPLSSGSGPSEHVGPQHSSIFHSRASHHAEAGFTSTPLKVLVGHTRCVTALLSHPTAGYLFSCSLDGSLRIWDYVSGTVLVKYGHHEELKCMTLRADCPEVVVGTNQASILRYSAKVPNSSCEATKLQDRQAVTVGSGKPEVLEAATSAVSSTQQPLQGDEEDEEEAAAKQSAAAKEGRKWRFGAGKDRAQCFIDVSLKFHVPIGTIGSCRSDLVNVTLTCDTKLAQQLHAHSVQYAHKLVTIRRAIENKNTSHSQALEPGASSNPPDPH
ncbi:WD40-repeat-containing domain protein [Dunaliella salina]|uniref:WD40-repeat-containing domain protein n=1 Tax=Dunaliella salina TaxID=3046 RepID=A0ABQ7G909_DUNSA|nr:WD40-repeat-containing domain protein [Dunaliella salina]|eukprot:KAF5831098.1 WD40-repeat-containing domain protein [Dunaliella salina]